jgi:hypothetical protein
MNRIAGVLGNVAKHILGSLERAFRMMALTGIIVALVVGLATEAVGIYFTGYFPPSGATHLAAAALAIAFGYAAAVTVAIGEILRGLIKGIELIVSETEHLADEGLHEIEGLAQRGEGEALRLGRSALGDAASLGRGVIGGAESLEHGITSHLPGHHRDPQVTGQMPATIPTLNPGQSGR